MRRPEAHGRRAVLEWRILNGNRAANGFAICLVVAVLGALDPTYREMWVITAIFLTAAVVSTVRFVTAMRIELIHMGPPGPGLLVDNTNDDWN